jgi:proteasome accessory factor B
VGYDLDRQAERVFRLSRVQGKVTLTGKTAAYDVPPGTDVKAVAHRLVHRTPDIEATVLVRQRAGVALRRRASAIEEDVAGPDDVSAWDRLTVSGQVHDLANSVLSLGSNAVVEAPEDLRADVISRLRGVTT